MRLIHDGHMLNLMIKRMNNVSNRARLILMALVVAMWPALVWAQAGAPQAPILKKSPPVWLGFLVMALLLIIVMFVSLMPSKRSHQD